MHLLLFAGTSHSTQALSRPATWERGQGSSGRIDEGDKQVHEVEDSSFVPSPQDELGSMDVKWMASVMNTLSKSFTIDGGLD